MTRREVWAVLLLAIVFGRGGEPESRMRDVHQLAPGFLAEKALWFNAVSFEESLALVA